MINRELDLRKLDAVGHHAARPGVKLPAVAEVLSADEDLRDILSNNLCQVVQGAFDVAAHGISHIGARVPDTYAEGFDLLGSNGVIDTARADCISNDTSIACLIKPVLIHANQKLHYRSAPGRSPAPRASSRPDICGIDRSVTTTS